MRNTGLTTETKLTTRTRTEDTQDKSRDRRGDDKNESNNLSRKEKRAMHNYARTKRKEWSEVTMEMINNDGGIQHWADRNTNSTDISAHPGAPTEAEDDYRAKIDCIFYKTESCNRDDKCSYSHSCEQDKGKAKNNEKVQAHPTNPTESESESDSDSIDLECYPTTTTTDSSDSSDEDEGDEAYGSSEEDDDEEVQKILDQADLENVGVSNNADSADAVSEHSDENEQAAYTQQPTYSRLNTFDSTTPTRDLPKRAATVSHHAKILLPSQHSATNKTQGVSTGISDPPGEE